jgi:hypothetical protein
MSPAQPSACSVCVLLSPWSLKGSEEVRVLRRQYALVCMDYGAILPFKLDAATVFQKEERAVQKHWTTATWRGGTGSFEGSCSSTKITLFLKHLLHIVLVANEAERFIMAGGR